MQTNMVGDKMLTDYRSYIEEQIRNGYWEEGTLEPIKCDHCDGTILEYCNYQYESYYVVEYEKWCLSCAKKIGHWSYGNWEI